MEMSLLLLLACLLTATFNGRGVGYLHAYVCISFHLYLYPQH